MRYDEFPECAPSLDKEPGPSEPTPSCHCVRCDPDLTRDEPPHRALTEILASPHVAAPLLDLLKADNGSRIRDIMKDVFLVNRSKGFITPTKAALLDTDFGMHVGLGKLMLMTTELSEAAEAVRKADFENLGEELADAVIRIFDFAAGCEIDLEHHIITKIRTNAARPFKHGKRG